MLSALSARLNRNGQAFFRLGRDRFVPSVVKKI